MHVLISLCALFVTGLVQAQLMEPEGPLQRDEVRLQEFLFEITLWQLPESGADAPLHLPLDCGWSMESGRSDFLVDRGLEWVDTRPATYA